MYYLHLSIAKYLWYEVLSMWSVSPLNALFFFKSENIIIINQVFQIYTHLSGQLQEVLDQCDWWLRYRHKWIFQGVA